jgi:YD repeat-containing protein
VETLGGVTTTYNYTYDTAGRLTEVKQNGVTVSTYTYDQNSNRLTGSAGTTTYTYDAQDRLLTSGATAYTYTANGELLTKTVGGQTITYTYDALGNLLLHDFAWQHPRVVSCGWRESPHRREGQRRAGPRLLI